LWFVETNASLLLLQKTMVLLEGVARELAGEFNMWASAKPLITRWAARHMGPIGKAEVMAQDAKRSARQWMQLPERIDTVMQQLGQKQESPLRHNNVTVVRLTGALLLAAAGALTTCFVGDINNSPLIVAGATASAIIGLMLVLHE
jgi:ubiquinone biosynthesis protein